MLKPLRVVKPFAAEELAAEQPTMVEFQRGETLYLKVYTDEKVVLARRTEVDDACRAAVVGEILAPQHVEFEVATKTLLDCTTPI